MIELGNKISYMLPETDIDRREHHWVHKSMISNFSKHIHIFDDHHGNLTNPETYSESFL